jgi:NAD-dependent SIR2 family protein deacetylase
MQRSNKKNPGRQRVSRDALLTMNTKKLACQECREICPPKEALGTAKRPRCPKCGGVLNRE